MNSVMWICYNVYFINIWDKFKFLCNVMIGFKNEIYIICLLERSIL